MGVSTDGQICYGILIDEEEGLPWENEEFDWTIENWWRKLQGFQSSAPILDDEGNYLNGVEPTEEQEAFYFKERKAFDQAHPLPLAFESVNVCSGNNPEYILAIPDTCLTANRGYPKSFAPGQLVVSEESRAALVKFCQDYEIATDGEPKWWLSSYYG